MMTKTKGVRQFAGGLTPKRETFGNVTTCIQWGRILCVKGRGRSQSLSNWL